MRILSIRVAAWSAVACAVGTLAGGVASCSSDTVVPPAPDAFVPPDEAGADVPEIDAATPFCTAQGLTALPFSAGPYGVHRGDVADDFQLPLADGSTFSFKSSFTGCESYVFIPDSITVSQADSTSVWASAADLAALVKVSPKNVHYFFISVTGSASIQAMQGRVQALVGKLVDPDATHWANHLHVVGSKAQDLGNWMATAAVSYLGNGFAIDRAQKIRGIGSLADVSRFDSSLQSASLWPWKSNLAYAANEVVYMNGWADQQAKLDAENAKVVPLFNGEVLTQFAETDVMLPSASEIAGYDTLEVEVTQMCPNADKTEENSNCGAWDYLAYLFAGQPSSTDAGAADGGDGGITYTNTEIARFITSYHRETHWVVDASPMLLQLKNGGMQHFRWEFAPPWNGQPTATKLSLRFSNLKKGYAPAQATFLYAGGAFNSHYDDNRTPVSVPIPSTAKRVELWAIITGHGSDTTTQCSEFCNHQHQFTVNGTQYTDQFPGAQSQDGCVKTAATGTTPNQSGTWWFGRGGWCPGAAVPPWVVDVTKDVTPGQTATVSYQGLLAGGVPPDGTGNIVMTSYLVVYE